MCWLSLKHSNRAAGPDEKIAEFGMPLLTLSQAPSALGSMRRRSKLLSGGRVAPRNIYLGPRRTSLRLEAVMWDALADIAQDQDKTVDDIILELSRERPHDLNLSAAIRVYIVEFYRARFKARRTGSLT